MSERKEKHITSEKIVEDPRWKFHALEVYKPVEEEGWEPCPTCGVKPRAWVFNGGRFAKCLCSDLLGESQARAESIDSLLKRTGGHIAGYHPDAIRDAWNRFVDTGERQNSLPAGRW